ncbi:MAG: substrate-binding domain-containing protein [Candidatus Bathyarchaeia archaeon]
MSGGKNFPEILGKKISRRAAVGTAAKVAGAAVAGLVIGGLAGYFAGTAAAPVERTVTTTIRETVPTTVRETVKETVTAAAATVTVPTTVRETVTVTATAPGVTAPGLAELRRELAQRYKTAKPGDKFLVTYITAFLYEEPSKYDWQGTNQAADQLGLDSKAIEAGTEVLKWIEAAESAIAAGSKGLVTWCSPPSAIIEIVKTCNEEKVFVATSYNRDPEFRPGPGGTKKDAGPYFLMEFSNMGDEMSFMCITPLFEKMRKYKRTKVLHIQASKKVAIDSTALINQGIAIAWQRYPDIQLLGHYWGEWVFDVGRQAADQALAVRTDYEGMWCHNDDIAMGAVTAFKARGIDIGPFTSARDAIVAYVERVVAGELFITCLTEFQYFGGKRTVSIYDAATGASYPLKDEVIQAPWTTVVFNTKDPKLREENLDLIKRSGLWWHPNFIWVDAEDLLKFLKTAEKYPSEKYPYDFRTLSVGKSQELGLTFDRHAKCYITANDYYYVPLMKRFRVSDDRTKGENLEEFFRQFALTMEYFLDLNWDTYEQNMAKLKEADARGLKLEPVWGTAEAIHD